MTISLLRAAGLTAALLCQLLAQPIPPVIHPVENPTNPDKVMLGKILFWEEQLGRDNTVACGTCHRPEVGGGDPRTFSPLNLHPGTDGLFGTADDARGSRGVVRCDSNGLYLPDPIFYPFPQVTKRKASPSIGAAWDPQTFWDGRVGPQFLDPVTQQVVITNHGALEAQAALPPTSGEMGCGGTTLALLATKLVTARPLRLASAIPTAMQAAIVARPTYPQLFQAAFGDASVTAARIAMALATYERELVPDQTPFDAFMAGNPLAMTPSQQQGRAVFMAHCATCHVPPLFTDHGFRNIGVRPPAEDHGRQDATGLPADRGKFKVPGLRNVGLRAPYFHQGGADSLIDVVLFYERGGDFSDNLDPLMQPFTLSHSERLALVDFLQNALTDARVANALPPFDRPILFSELLPNNPDAFGTRTSGSGAIAPQMVAPSPAMIGSDRFGIGVAHALGGATSLLALSPIPAGPGANIAGVPIFVNLDPSTIIVPLPLSGAPGVPGAGYGAVTFALPDDPALSGITIYAQWAVLDAGAAVGLAASEGLQFTFVRP